MVEIKIPPKQILWETICDENHTPKFIITSDLLISKYFLYNVTKELKLEKIESGNTPLFKKIKRI